MKVGDPLDRLDRGAHPRGLRRSCRYRVIGDRRPELRADGTPYIYALLHAHQISAVFVNDEQRDRLAAMVSRSADGDLLVPGLRIRGVVVARGSSRRRNSDKGGRAALEELRELLERRVAVLLAVDGPRGPRNEVHRGVAMIAQQVKGAVVLPTMVVPDRRWFFSHSWDRIQLPLPFSTVTLDGRVDPSRARRIHRGPAARDREGPRPHGRRVRPDEAERSRQARLAREAAALSA